MEVIGALTFLALFGLGGWGINWRFKAKRDARRALSAKWDAFYESKNGAIYVLVRKIYIDRNDHEHVLESSECAVIQERMTDWETIFHQEMSAARSRAIALNSEQKRLR